MRARTPISLSRFHVSPPVLRALVLALAVLALYVLRLDDVAGVINDDAWYMVLAKAIAEGHGPRLISSAGAEFLSNVYPPGFPALLSLVFLVSPFPDNLMLLKSLSIAGMMGAGVLMFHYAATCRNVPRPVALLMAVVLVLTPAFVFLATSTLMSEPVFLCIQLAAVVLIERTARAVDDRAGRRAAVLAGVVAAVALLTRTAGLTIGAAGLLYLMRERRWRSALAFGVAAAICVMPWWLYARANAPTRAELVDHGGLMTLSYADQFWTSEAGTVTARPVGVEGLPARVIYNAANIAIRDVGGIFMPLLFRTPAESGIETFGLGPPEGFKVPSMGGALGTKVISFALTALAIVGFVVACRRRVTVAEPLVVMALAMIVLWPFWTFRFILPLVPFLLLYLVFGVETLAGWLGRGGRRAGTPAAAARIFLLVLIGLHVMDHTEFVVRAYGGPRSVVWKMQVDDINQVFDWLRRHAPPGSVVAADNPALVYLRTGLRTVAIHSLDEKWSRWRRMNVRYVVSISEGEKPDDPRAELRFKHPHRNIWVYELLPEVPPQSVASTTHSPFRSVLNNTR